VNLKLVYFATLTHIISLRKHCIVVTRSKYFCSKKIYIFFVGELEAKPDRMGPIKNQK